MLSNGNRMPQQEFRHMSSGSLNIPPGGINGGQPQNGGMGGRFDQARSPPGKQSQSTYLSTSLPADGT